MTERHRAKEAADAKARLAAEAASQATAASKGKKASQEVLRFVSRYPTVTKLPSESGNLVDQSELGVRLVQAISNCKQGCNMLTQ